MSNHKSVQPSCLAVLLDAILEEHGIVHDDVLDWFADVKIAPPWRVSFRDQQIRGDLVEIYQHSGMLTVRFSERSGVQNKRLRFEHSYSSQTKDWQQARVRADQALELAGWALAGGGRGNIRIDAHDVPLLRDGAGLERVVERYRLALPEVVERYWLDANEAALQRPGETGQRADLDLSRVMERILASSSGDLGPNPGKL